MIQLRYPGEQAYIGIWRQTPIPESRSIAITLRHIPPFIPDTLAAKPEYVIFAGLVFVPLSKPFVDSYVGKS